MSKSIKNLNIERSVFLFDEFYQDSVEKVIRELYALNEADDKSDIFLFISSYGGYIDSLNAVLDSIKDISNPINTIVFGNADSCASVLASSGVKGKRYIGENARFMIHEASAGIWGTTSDIEKDLEDLKKVEARLVSLLSLNSGNSESDIREMITGADYALTAEEAVSKGFMDVVVSANPEDYLQAENSSNNKGANKEGFTSFVMNLKKSMVVKNKKEEDSIMGTPKGKDTPKVGEGQVIISSEANNNMINQMSSLTEELKILKASQAVLAKEKEELQAKFNSDLATMTSKFESEKASNDLRKKEVFDAKIENLKELVGRTINQSSASDLIDKLISSNANGELLDMLTEVFNVLSPTVDLGEMNIGGRTANNSSVDMLSAMTAKSSK